MRGADAAAARAALLSRTTRHMLTEGSATASARRRSGHAANSLIMALGIAVGKIAISIISAYRDRLFPLPAPDDSSSG
jgi:ABC-type glycerol-3-phosphate transport system permease component